MIFLVYCPKCGTENTDDALVCKNCATNLKIKSYKRNRSSDEICFRNERDSHIWGLIFGLLVISWGITTLLKDVVNWLTWDKIWPFFIIIIGIYIAYNSLKR